MGEAEFFQELLCFFPPFCLGHLRLGKLHHPNDIILYTQVAEHRGLLGQVAYPQLGALIHRQTGNVYVIEPYFPGIGLDQSHRHIKRCGFTCTVRTQQTYNFPLFHLVAHVVIDQALPVFLDQVFRT
ncbi:hypothetical protein D9M69_564340 [compost metagenome]